MHRQPIKEKAKNWTACVNLWFLNSALRNVTPSCTGMLEELVPTVKSITQKFNILIIAYIITEYRTDAGSRTPMRYKRRSNYIIPPLSFNDSFVIPKKL